MYTLELIKNTDVETPPFFYLQQFYEFEFSSITNSEINDQGLFDYKALQSSWNNGKYEPYLFKMNKKLPVGFAIVNLNSQIDGDANTRDIAEFFIMPNHRKKGVGKMMATQIFNLYKTKWEVRQLFNAENSRVFWLNVIKQYTNNNFNEKSITNHSLPMYVQQFASNNYGK